MEQPTTHAADAAQQTAQRAKESAPPSVLGDVEDAVTPQAEGDLTPWMPPDQPEGEEKAED